MGRLRVQTYSLAFGASNARSVESPDRSILRSKMNIGKCIAFSVGPFNKTKIPMKSGLFLHFVTIK